MTPSRSFTVASYWLFRMRRNWVVAGIPGAQTMVEGSTVPPDPVLEPPLPVLEPPLPVLEPPLPVLTLPPLPVLTLPPVPVLWLFMVPEQLAALASRTPARPVRMKCLICVLTLLPAAQRDDRTIGPEGGGFPCAQQTG